MSHPSTHLKPEWVKIIREAVPAAEKAGMLQPEQLTLVHEQGWFKFLVPQVYGGLQLPLPDMVRLEESLAWANGSLGWVVTLCAGAGWFGGFLSPQIAPLIFADSHLCLAGSGAATGTATISGDGYLINGHWKYASGVHHATHLTANCIIKQGDETMLNDDGTPLILPFIFDRKDVTLISTWKFMGMMGTGSDAYEVHDLFVEKNRCFKIDAADAVIAAPLYQYPFIQLAEATLAANISGMAVHFTDLCAAVFDKKPENKYLTTDRRAVIKQLHEKFTNRLNAVRQEFYGAVDASWQGALMGKATHLQQIGQSSRKLARTARECVDELFPYCGLQAANPETELNQVWRDLHTASQHSLLVFED
jgi:alkylation response protein AidB-like acyl-CoA dehydrogenase